MNCLGLLTVAVRESVTSDAAAGQPVGDSLLPVCNTSDRSIGEKDNVAFADIEEKYVSRYRRKQKALPPVESHRHQVKGKRAPKAEK